MARNSEKQLGQLNRIHLQKLHEDEERRNPSRPFLSKIHNSADIKKWIPSIKRDIDFNLQQMKVSCFPESKICEFSEKVDELKREYRAFLRKLKLYEPHYKVDPWTERSYSSNRHNGIYTSSSLKNVKKDDTSVATSGRLSLPLLESQTEQNYVDCPLSSDTEDAHGQSGSDGYLAENIEILDSEDARQFHYTVDWGNHMGAGREECSVQHEATTSHQLEDKMLTFYDDVGDAVSHGHINATHNDKASQKGVDIVNEKPISDVSFTGSSTSDGQLAMKDESTWKCNDERSAVEAGCTLELKSTSQNRNPGPGNSSADNSDCTTRSRSNVLGLNYDSSSSESESEC